MKHWEKIFLVVSILVLLVAVWISRSTESVSPDQLGRATISAYTMELDDYESLQSPPVAAWDAPRPQDEEGRWLYRVFTPPILYLVDGRLDPVPEEEEEVVEEVEIPPFGVRFARVERERYRLQLDAVYEMDIGDMSTARFIFENVNPGLTEPPTYALTIGATNTEGQFRLENVERNSIRDEGGGSITEHVATITDLIDGRTVVLSDNENLFREGITMIFESTIDSSIRAEVENPGDSFEMNDAVYTVLDINLDRGIATVVKEAEYLDMPEQEVLRLGERPRPQRVQRSAAGPAPVRQPQQEAPSDNDDLMDLFN